MSSKMADNKKTAAIINDLQLIRTDLRSYIAHKETTSYVSFALSLAFFQYFWTTQNISWGSHILIIFVLIVNHIFMRWALRLRLRSTAQRWVCERAIAYAITQGLTVEETEYVKGKTSDNFQPRNWLELFVPAKTLDPSFAGKLSTYRFYQNFIREFFETDRERYRYHINAFLKGRPYGDELPSIGSLIMIALSIFTGWCK